jgi:hypothetical protein
VSRVAIYVFLHKPSREEPRTAVWSGDVDWPGAPRKDDTWFHCSEWAGETVNRASFYAPAAPGEHAFVLEIRTDVEVLRHLLDEHGFTE